MANSFGRGLMCQFCKAVNVVMCDFAVPSCRYSISAIFPAAIQSGIEGTVFAAMTTA